MFFFRTNGTLPENAYDPLEAAFEAFSDPAKAGTFRGGMGVMMLVQYHETPVGSYNEMLVLPGAFDVPPGNRPKGSRVTRIYVDQKATTYNGKSLF